MELFCGRFIREVSSHYSSQKNFFSVYIFIYGIYEIIDW